MKRELLALVGLGVLAGDAAPGPGGREGGSEAGREAEGRASRPPGRGGDGRERLQGGEQADRRPGHDERRDERDSRCPARPEHGGHPALRPGDERHPDLGPRHQPDRPAGDLDARHVPARDRRRAVGLPRLLRARAVGPRAVADLGRDQADRGGARPGVRRLGRQRRERGGEHHHQDAARERGPGSRAGRRALRPRRGVARVRGERLPVQRQLLVRERDQRHVVVPPERGLLQLGPLLAPRRHRPARLPSPGSRPLPHGDGSGGERGIPDRRRRLSRGRRPAGRLRERRDQPAEVRPALRPGLLERGPDDLRELATTAPRGSSTPGSGRSGWRAGRTWRTVGWGTPRARCGSMPSATSWTPRRRTCSCPTRTPWARSSSRSRPRPTTSRSGTRTCWAGSTS